MKKNINMIKQKWFKDSFLTSILAIILIVIFILVNFFISKLDLVPIDFTKEKLYTLSEDSKMQIKNINEDVHIYFFGYDELNPTIILAKQYKDINNKISAEAIEISKRPDLAQKYGIDNNMSIGIIVESQERYKVLTSNDFITYDTTTFETIDITEQKLTNAIIDTTIAKKANIYFLTGHEEKNILDELVTINAFIQNEINNVYSLDLLKQEFPKDCDCLVIPNPQKDFADIETNKILEYINRGGNIVWLDNPSIKDVDYPNINKILDNFGFKFSKGLIGEQDQNKMVLNNPFLILPNISYNDITKDLYTGAGVVFAGAGKIVFQDDEKLKELGLEINNLLTSSDKSVYIEDYTATSFANANNIENGPFILGAQINKKIDDQTNAKIIVFSNYNFMTDITVNESTNLKLINLYNNKDLILNSIAFLTDREDTIRIRKDLGLITYTATNKQDLVVKLIIFIIPIAIIIFGIIVWIIRRKNR